MGSLDLRAKMKTHFVHSSILVFALCACASVSKTKIDEPYHEPAPRLVEARNELAQGDTLTVEYSRDYPTVEAYPLGIGDQIDIEVYRHPELSLSTTIAPDGTITFHQIGTLKAAGATLEVLRAQLSRALAPLFPDPIVSVFLKTSDMRVARFLELLLSHPTGALREVHVAPDGGVSLPGIGAVQVAGLTALEAQTLFNEKLRGTLPTLSVYVTTKHQSGDVFTVMGEVGKPGRYALDSDFTLVEALAAAGGGTPVSDLEHVLVISHPTVGEPVHAHLYDIQDALAHGNSMSGVQIRPRDTVLVLRTGIGNVNQAIDLYIRKNLPFNISLGYRLD